MDEFLVAFEKDDPKLKDQKPCEQKKDMENKFDNNCNEERKLLFGYIPSAMEKVNKLIIDKKNIQSLL